MEESNEQEPEEESTFINWEEELEDPEFKVGNDPFLMTTEEAEQFLAQAGIHFTDYGEFEELESDTVSVDSSDDPEYPLWDYRYPGEEDDEEEYRDPAPPTKANVLQYWDYLQEPRVSDAECSSGSESDSEETSHDYYPRVSAITWVQDSPPGKTCKNWKPGQLVLIGILGMILGLTVHPVSTTTHENVIFESIGEMAGATSYLHVQVTISLSSITQQFELYKAKLQARFSDPHKGAAIINQQFAKNMNMSVNSYLESRKEDDGAAKPKTPFVKVLPAPHMNTAIIWSRIAQLHYEDLYEIGLHLTALKNLLPRVPMDNRDRVVAASNFFTNIQPNMRKDNQITDNMEAENEFLEKYPDLEIPDHLSKRYRRSALGKVKRKRKRFDRGINLFQPPAGTRLEDWFFFEGTSRNGNTSSYWFHVCPFLTNRQCSQFQNMSHIPVENHAWDEDENGWLDDSYYPNKEVLDGFVVATSEPHPATGSFITSLKHVNNLDIKPKIRTPTKRDARKEKYRSRGEGSVTLRRKKRLAGLIALPIAVAASAMGIYNTAQIEYLKGQLTEIKENTGRLFTVVDNHENAIQDLEAGMNLLTTYMIQLFEQNPSLLDARFSRIENQMRDRIRQSTHALQAAQHRRLAVDLLSPNQVNTMFDKLNARALEFNCELLVKFPSDLLQLEVSMLFDGEDAHLLLHVPMMPKESVLRLFRLHPFPLPLYEDHFLIPDVKNDVLAVSSTDQRLHMQLSSIDLMGCHRMNQLFLCDQFGVLSQKFNKTCLGSLYMQDFKSAQEICEFNIEPVSEKVYALRKNRFLVFLPKAMTVPIKCVNGTKTEKHLGAGSQTFTLSSGCEAQFSEHLVLSDLNIKMPADVLHFTWDWVPTDLFDAPSEQVAPDLQKLARLGMSRPKLKDLQYQISASSSGYWISWHNILLYVITGVTTVLVMIVCYQVCIKKPRISGTPETGIFTNMLALMGLQQHQASRNVNVRYDNANNLDDEQRLHYEGASRYPDIATRPDQLLSRLQGMQTEMEVLKERNKNLEETRSATYPSAPSIQNPRLF